MKIATLTCSQMELLLATFFSVDCLNGCCRTEEDFGGNLHSRRQPEKPAKKKKQQKHSQH